MDTNPKLPFLMSARVARDTACSGEEVLLHAEFCAAYRGLQRKKCTNAGAMT